MSDITNCYKQHLKKFYTLFVENNTSEDTFPQAMWAEFNSMAVPEKHVCVGGNHELIFTILLTNAEELNDAELYASNLCNIYDFILAYAESELHMLQRAKAPQPIALSTIEYALEVMYDYLYHDKIVTRDCIEGYIKEALRELDELAEYANIPHYKESMLRSYLKRNGE